MHQKAKDILPASYHTDESTDIPVRLVDPPA